MIVNSIHLSGKLTKTKKKIVKRKVENCIKIILHRQDIIEIRKKYKFFQKDIRAIKIS